MGRFRLTNKSKTGMMVMFTGKKDKKVHLPAGVTKTVDREGEPVRSRFYIAKEMLEIEELTDAEKAAEPAAVDSAEAKEAVGVADDVSVEVRTAADSKKEGTVDPKSASSGGPTAAASSAGKKKKGSGGPKKPTRSSS